MSEAQEITATVPIRERSRSMSPESPCLSSAGCTGRMSASWASRRKWKRMGGFLEQTRPSAQQENANGQISSKKAECTMDGLPATEEENRYILKDVNLSKNLRLFVYTNDINF